MGPQQGEQGAAQSTLLSDVHSTGVPETGTARALSAAPAFQSGVLCLSALILHSAAQRPGISLAFPLASKALLREAQLFNLELGQTEPGDGRPLILTNK